MATATIVTDLSTNLITACDSTTADGTWSGVTAGLGTTDPAQLEGSGRLDFIVKSTTDSQNDIYFDPTASKNLSGEHLRFMCFTALKAVVKTVANLGIELWMSDGTNGAWYTVSGEDRYIGGWETLVLDSGATKSSGTDPTLSAITQIGIIFRLVGAAKNVDTVWLDYITYGDGFQAIYGGTSYSAAIALSDIAAQDTYYKIFEEIGGIFRARGELIFGDNISTNTTYFADPGKVIMFDDLVVSSTLFKINGVGNATGVTYLDFSGIFISSETTPYSVAFTDATVDEVLMNGTTWQNASTIDLSSIVTGNATVFDGCETVDPGGATLDGCVIKNSSVTGTTAGSLDINVDTEAEACENMSFSGYTGATTYAIFVDSSVTEFDMTNWIFDDPNNTTSYALYWEGAAGTLTINALGTTNLVTAGCTSAGGTVTVVAAKSYTLTGLIAGTEVRAYVGIDPDTSVEIDGIESSGTSFQFGHEEGGNAGYINIIKEEYEPITIWLTYPSVDTSIPIQQDIDRTYINP